MQRIPAFLKNKYILSALFTLLYILILHDTDVFALIKRKERVAQLELEIENKKVAIEELRTSLEGLDDLRTLEKYAREEHLFKKDDEDIFIFSFE